MIICNNSKNVKIISQSASATEMNNSQTPSVDVNTDNSLFPFTNSNLWVRILDKKSKINEIIRGAESFDELDESQKQLLSDMFRNEIGTYGDMMFNISSEQAKKSWDFRNSLSPLLDSLLFTTKLNVSSIEEDEEESELFTNNPLATVSESLGSNDNIALTQIENIESVLNKIKEGTQPASHQELHNKIRVLNWDVNWVNEGFVTRDAKLKIYLEHEQLLKTKAIEYLMTLNNRIKISAEFYDMFSGDENLFKSFLKQFSESNDISFQDYTNIISASQKENEKDRDVWTIFNFETEFDGYDGVVLTLHVVSPGFETKKRLEDVKPIHLLNENVINYFREKGIIKVSTDNVNELNSDPDLIYLPRISFHNTQTTRIKSESQNKTSSFKLYFVADAANFMLHLIWLWAWEYKRLYDKINPVQKLNKNFLITLEVDLSSPSNSVNQRERFNGPLLSYINTTLENNEDFNSISFFDYNRLKFWMTDNSLEFSNFAFQFNGRNYTNWSWDFINGENYQELEYDEDINTGWFIWKDLLTSYPQACFIEEIEKQLSTINLDDKVIEIDDLDPENFEVISRGDETITIRKNIKDFVLPREEENFAPRFTEGLSLTDPLEYYFRFQQMEPDALKNVDKSSLEETSIREKSLGLKDATVNQAQLESRAKGEISELNVNVEKITDYYYSYSHPIYNISMSDNAWYQKFNLPIDDFLKDIISYTFDTRKIAIKNFSIINSKPEDLDITNKLSPNVNYGNENNISESTWKVNSESILIEKHKTKKQKLIKNGKEVEETSETERWENLIDSQLSPDNELSIKLIPHDKSYKETIDPAHKKFIEKMLGENGNLDWVEIIISDTTEYRMTTNEYQIYQDIQKYVFDKLDNNIVSINKYYDNNILSLVSQSETVSNIPYQLGAFTQNINVNESFDKKLNQIKNVIKEPGILSPSDKKKLENTISMMELMTDFDKNDVTNAKNVTRWVSSVKNGTDTAEMYNAISGVDYISSPNYVGIKERLITSLYDALLYKANGKNLYVPGIKLFSPVYIYSALESSSAISKSLRENQALETSDIFDLNSKVAPQTGIYKITNLNDSVDEFGLRTQSWEALKLDYGFMNLAHKILYDRKDVQDSLNILGSLENIFNYFDSGFVIPSAFFGKDKFSGLSITSYSSEMDDYVFMYNKQHLNSKESQNFSWLNSTYNLISHPRYLEIDDESNVVDRYKMALSFYLLGSCGEVGTNQQVKSTNINTYLYQNLWPLSNNIEDIGNYRNSFEYYKKTTKSINENTLQKQYDQNWINTYPVRTYNIYSLTVPYRACAFAMNANDWWYSTDVNRVFSGFLSQLYSGDSSKNQETVISSEESKPIHEIDSFIPKDDIEDIGTSNVFENLNDLSNALENKSISLDPGTVITIQREDHPAISEDLAFNDSEIIIDGNNIKSENLKVFDKFNNKKISNWRTLEKYIILDSPSVVGVVGSKNSENFFLKMSDTPSEGLSSWTKFVKASIDTRDTWNGWLNEYKLGYGSTFYGLSTSTYHHLMIGKWAQSVLANFFDRLYVYEPYVLSQPSTGNYTIEVDQFGNEREPEWFPRFYKRYIDFDEYKSAIDSFLEWDSMKDLRSRFVNSIQIKLDSFVSTSGFAEDANGDISQAKRMVDKKYENLKKDFLAEVTTNIVPNFLLEWLEKAKVRLEELDTISNEWTDLDSMLFDFVLLNTSIDNINKTKRFSAIRWSYLDKRTLNNSIGTSFNGEFITNISINQLLGICPRNEKVYFEKVGYEQLVDEEKQNERAYDKWFWTESDKENYKSASSFEDVTYIPEDRENNFSGSGVLKNKDGYSISDYQRKYGSLRIIIDDKFTAKSIFQNQDFTLNPDKLQIIDNWNFNNLIPDVNAAREAEPVFLDFYNNWDNTNYQYYSVKKQALNEDPEFI